MYIPTERVTINPNPVPYGMVTVRLQYGYNAVTTSQVSMRNRRGSGRNRRDARSSSSGCGRRFVSTASS